MNDYTIPLTPEDVAEAAGQLGTPIRPRLARDAIRAGRIGYVDMGSRRYTSGPDIVKWIATRYVEPREHQAAQAV